MLSGGVPVPPPPTAVAAPDVDAKHPPLNLSGFWGSGGGSGGTYTESVTKGWERTGIWGEGRRLPPPPTGTNLEGGGGGGSPCALTLSASPPPPQSGGRALGNKDWTNCLVLHPWGGVGGRGGRYEGYRGPSPSPPPPRTHPSAGRCPISREPYRTARIGCSPYRTTREALDHHGKLYGVGGSGRGGGSIPCHKAPEGRGRERRGESWGWGLADGGRGSNSWAWPESRGRGLT